MFEVQKYQEEINEQEKLINSEKQKSGMLL